jgi:hypothetical protein
MTRLEWLQQQKRELGKEARRLEKKKNRIELSIVRELNKLNASPDVERERRSAVRERAINY